MRKGNCSRSSLEKSFNNQCRELIDCLVARPFYFGGLSFHFAKNPYFIELVKYAANKNLACYIPPGYNRLRKTLLQKERGYVDKLLETIKRTWKEKGLSIVSDGWIDSQRRLLISFMAT